ncbi:MAG: hypothetical protein AAGA85_23215 [Bacteroidota bacterium]
MKTAKNSIYTLLLMVLSVGFVACEQESFEPILTTEAGAGTLTEFTAYELSAMAGDSLNGRVVFWRGNDGKTLVQLSLYNVGMEEEMPSAIIGGATGDATGMLVDLYTVTNTGEGFDFGEFSTAKYFVIDDLDFYDGLAEYDAHVTVYADNSLTAIRTQGDIGLNADPIESN